MIREIEIEGFKSIDRLRIKPGRVTVLIGENGCGKSNILEAIAMAGAAASNSLGHEFLGSRGIRVTDSRLMLPRFPGMAHARARVVMDADNREPLELLLAPGQQDGLSGWHRLIDYRQILARFREETGRDLYEVIERVEPGSKFSEPVRQALERLVGNEGDDSLRTFLTYAPENTALRTFQQESQILPLGIRGEGLFAHLKQLRGKHPDVLAAISERLGLIDWFGGFDVPGDLAPYEQRLDIRDRYIDPLTRLDQRSANEGFLFLLFYYTLLISPQTPRFFAVDNVDASLNPRLCARLMRDVVELARAHDRQVIVTTHNPALLDGLDLTDPEQKLYVVFRDPDGPTRVERIKPPRPIEGAPEIRLSEAFIRGHLGGLPTNF